MASALAFNICLLLLPLAAAAAFIIISRDHLYAYEYSDAGARAVAARVERLNGELIQLDFDRQRQWDDLVAMELMAGDIAAARGFLLSGAGMLPSRLANQIERRANNGGDAAYELAALEFLTPGTRNRYEATVPLLSRRAASGAAQPRSAEPAPPLGDARDFELLARSMLSEADPDPLQFVITGFALGLGGEFTPRMARGAAALLSASRREDYPPGLGQEASALLGAAAPLADFRAAARTGAGDGDPAQYENASAAFREALSADGAAAAKAALDQIGAIAEATHLTAATAMITHASGLRDLERLLLVAQAAGDRAAAAAKRLPRDGRLISAARGELTITRELSIAIAIAAAAGVGLALIVLFMLFQLGRRIYLRMQNDDYAGELVEISGNNWRPL